MFQLVLRPHRLLRPIRCVDKDRSDGARFQSFADPIVLGTQSGLFSWNIS
jgi:hypothetical protein